MRRSSRALMGAVALGLTACATGQGSGPDLSEYSGEGTTVRQARADLNADGRDEVIVHVEGRDVCGSGGCLTLIFTPDDAGYRQIMRATVSRTPIGIAATRTGGWSDVVVGVGGGGLVDGRVVMSWDGAGYPSNPTVEPARPAPAGLAETIVIPAE